MQEIKREVRAFIATELGRDIGDVGDQASLLEAGILDSMGVLALVSFIQQRYGVEISDDDMMPEHFDSFDAIATYVASKRAALHE